MVQSELIGYLRLSKTGNTLKMNISVEAFENAERYLALDGTEFVTLVSHRAKVDEILAGGRDVTSICQVSGD